MMEMVNGSRFGVSLMGLGIHRRSFLEGAIYAAQREQWGQRIDRYPLVRETLVDLLVELEAGCALAFECAAATRTAESDEEGRALRRILVPLAKMRGTREAINAASQALELFGGNGYMEDWPMARQLRDAQCHTIWEGTENILCLDVRPRDARRGCPRRVARPVERALDGATHPAVAPTVDAVAGTLSEARLAIEHLTAASSELQLLHSRRFAYLLADLVEGALLLDEATYSLARDGDARKAVVAGRYARSHLAPPRVRGILDDDRTVLDQFDEIVRYGHVDPAAASTTLTPSVVWRVTPTLLTALDEHLGAPVVTAT